MCAVTAKEKMGIAGIMEAAANRKPAENFLEFSDKKLIGHAWRLEKQYVDAGKALRQTGNSSAVNMLFKAQVCWSLFQARKIGEEAPFNIGDNVVPIRENVRMIKPLSISYPVVKETVAYLFYDVKANDPELRWLFIPDRLKASAGVVKLVCADYAVA